MQNYKDSLAANQADILEHLPEQFHADFLKQLSDEAAAPAPLTGSDEVAAIKEELKANPAVDESAAAAELTNVEPPAPLEAVSASVLATEKASLLSMAQAQAAQTAKEVDAARADAQKANEQIRKDVAEKSKASGTVGL